MYYRLLNIAQLFSVLPKHDVHCLLDSSLPKHTVPREKLPMRDTMVFPTATKIPRPPKAMIPVPHQ